MKRRQSARPIVVEIKRTRTPLLGSDNSFQRSHLNNAIWRSTPLNRVTAETAFDQPQSAGVATTMAEPTPQRRILPNLTPMFMPSYPQQDEQSVERAPRRARPAKPAVKSPLSMVQPAIRAPSVNAETRVGQDTLELVPQAAQTCTDDPSELGRPKRPMRSKAIGGDRGHRDQKLRRGEFWKRRLPRACW